jgi:hypothetical protein
LWWLSLSGKLPCEHNDMGAVVSFIRDSPPSSFRRIVSQFANSGFANLDVPQNHPALAPPTQGLYACHECGSLHDSFQKFKVHSQSAHGLKDSLSLCVDGPTCPVCLLFMFNRVRVLEHLRYKSEVCRLNIISRGPIITRCEAEELDFSFRPSARLLAAKGYRRHSAINPVSGLKELAFRVPGPLPRVAVSPSMVSSHHSLGYGRNYYA